jgi:hypothetical protein
VAAVLALLMGQIILLLDLLAVKAVLVLLSYPYQQSITQAQRQAHRQSQQMAHTQF